MHQLDTLCLSPDGGSNNLDTSESVLTYRQLRERGWSRKMVTKHLGDADCHTVNPHVGSGRPMRLFSNWRVRQIEESELFRQDLVLAKARSESAVAQFHAKTAALNEIAASIEINVPMFGPSELRQLTEIEFGCCTDERQHLENELSFVLLRSKPMEWTLDHYYWHPGIRVARQKLRRRILAAVVHAYPTLAMVALGRGKLEKGEICG